MIFVFPTVLYYYNRPSLFCQPLLQKFCPPFFAGRGRFSAKALSFRDFATHGCLHTRENSPPVCRLQSRLKNAEPRKIASLPRLFLQKALAISVPICYTICVFCENYSRKTRRCAQVAGEISLENLQSRVSAKYQNPLLRLMFSLFQECRKLFLLKLFLKNSQI